MMLTILMIAIFQPNSWVDHGIALVNGFVLYTFIVVSLYTRIGEYLSRFVLMVIIGIPYMYVLIPIVGDVEHLRYFTVSSQLKGTIFTLLSRDHEMIYCIAYVSFFAWILYGGFHKLINS